MYYVHKQSVPIVVCICWEVDVTIGCVVDVFKVACGVVEAELGGMVVDATVTFIVVEDVDAVAVENVVGDEDVIGVDCLVVCSAVVVEGMVDDILVDITVVVVDGGIVVADVEESDDEVDTVGRVDLLDNTDEDVGNLVFVDKTDDVIDVEGIVEVICLVDVFGVVDVTVIVDLSGDVILTVEVVVGGGGVVVTKMK